MKFLCIACDEVMARTTVSPIDRGSLTLVFQCPACSNEIAMLTNPFETQVVGSLGVDLGASADGSEGDDSGAASKCPFSAVVQQMGLDVGTGSESEGMPWTEEASARLENMPDFARPMAKTGVEKFARDQGHTQVDGDILTAARDFFGM